jgi:glycine/D-amino acid oxidase-like deaminating enzyme
MKEGFCLGRIALNSIFRLKLAATLLGELLMNNYDVLVVGAGILGLSSASHIKLANPTLKILIVDRNVAAGLGSTVNSAAAFRVFFSSASNYALANSSVEFYRHLQQARGVDLKMRWCGYLWCFTEADYLRLYPVLKDLQFKSAETVEFKPEELAQTLGMHVNFPGDAEAQRLGLGDLYKAVYVPRAGLIGVMQLVHFYETEFLRLGGEIRYRTEVKTLQVEPKTPLGLAGAPFFWQEPVVTAAETSSGTIKASKTVVAAGAWLAQLLDPIGVECHVKARKRQVFNIQAQTEPQRKLLHNTDYSDEGLPFLVLAKPQVYLRPNLYGEGFGIGYADEFPRAYLPELIPKPEPEFYQQTLQPVVAKCLPQFVGAQTSGGFAGLYEINTLDEQPVIFSKHGMVVVGGGSGSGIMKADAIGKIAAAAYAGQEYAELWGGSKFKVSDLGLKNRRVEPEKLVI